MLPHKLQTKELRKIIVLHIKLSTIVTSSRGKTFSVIDNVI